MVSAPGLARLPGDAQGGERLQCLLHAGRGFARRRPDGVHRLRSETWPSPVYVPPDHRELRGVRTGFTRRRTTNLSEFCDHSIDAQMAHASAVQAQDPPAATVLWQRVESALAVQAPYVPIYNSRNVDFVSKRVGNYQYNPTSGALLSQLWVK